MRVITDHILVEPQQREEHVTESGIVVPESAVDNFCLGTVAAVGPGRQLECGQHTRMDVCVGDTIYYPKFSGTAIKREGREYRIISQSDVLLVL